MNATSLWLSFAEISNTGIWNNYTDENIGHAKANVTEHVATLLSTQPNQSVVEAASFLSQWAEYPCRIDSAEKRRNRC